MESWKNSERTHFHRLMHTVIFVFFFIFFCLLHPLRIMFSKFPAAISIFFPLTIAILNPREGEREKERRIAMPVVVAIVVVCYLYCPAWLHLLFHHHHFYFVLFWFLRFFFTPSCGALEALFHLSSELFFGRTQATLQFALHLKRRHSRLRRDAWWCHLDVPHFLAINDNRSCS